MWKIGYILKRRIYKWYFLMSLTIVYIFLKSKEIKALVKVSKFKMMLSSCWDSQSEILQCNYHLKQKKITMPLTSYWFILSHVIYLYYMGVFFIFFFYLSLYFFLLDYIMFLSDVFFYFQNFKIFYKIITLFMCFYYVCLFVLLFFRFGWLFISAYFDLLCR